MKTMQINLYSFNELNEEAKENAIKNYYENEDFPCLSEDLTESCYALLEEKGCEHNNIKLYYSLSYSQGDGLCFIGSIKKANKELILTHNYRYYFADSVSMAFYENGEEIYEDQELKSIYFDTCKDLEKEGYSILEYRPTFEEFNELCEVNDYTFLSDGTMKNY